MAHLLAVGRALPGQPHRQQEITDTIGPLLTRDPARIRTLHRLHSSTGVRTRHLALPLDQYRALSSFSHANDVFIGQSTPLAEEACRAALRSGQIRAAAIDLLVSTSVTGIAVPSIDVGLVGALGLRRDVRRMPSFGLGCAGGAAGIAHLNHALRGNAQHVAMLVSVELCSLTIQHGDDSIANLVASGLFGDGAAAVLMVGDEHDAVGTSSGVDVLGSRSVLYSGTADQLGWHIGDTGFAIMLAPGLPDTIAEHLADDVDTLLATHALNRRAISTWVVHAGGPRIFDAVAAALDLDDDALAVSRKSLASVGNLSSSSVLHVLADVLEGDHLEPGGHGVLMAFGPGVGVELVLLHRPDRG